MAKNKELNREKETCVFGLHRGAAMKDDNISRAISQAKYEKYTDVTST